ncbi:MAG: hypothetical protein OXH67_14500 [Acidimicrobiaceae bacterium]|nr:hypothetical protein [Acidimicrobiaceae bacterium]MXX55432.1 hypothetical protein [Gemmatimonadota bacterium]MYC69398.1 hypothetical protein [Gemmatimonadota bacterium]MYJ01098.1 hypothetical protein [Chloroflexota bacterium]
MEIPTWVTSNLAYFTALCVWALFLKNLMTERKKKRHQQERAEQGLLKEWWSDSKSQIVNWRKTLDLLKDAIEATANLMALIGVVVILVAAFYLMAALPFALPSAVLLPSLGVAIVGASVLLVVVHKLTEQPPADNGN